MELARRAGPKLLTLGLPAILGRNAILSLGFTPRLIGNDSLLVDTITISAAIAFSHPLELARVLIVNNGANEGGAAVGNVMATLRSVYANEGLAGMYRGLAPRFLYQLPILMTFAEVLFPDE